MASLGTLLEQLFVSVKADTSGMDAPINRSADNIKKRAREISTNLTSIGKNIRGVGAILTAGITVPLIAAGGAATNTSAKIADMEAKFNVVFGNLSDDTKAWAKTTADALGRSRYDLQGYAADLQATLVPLGLTREEGAKLSKGLAQLSVDMASFHNISDADALEALRSAIVGNHETLKKYGVVINDTILKQELYNMLGLEGAKNATEAEKAQARFNIIMRQTVDVQGDAIRSADSQGNQMKRLRAELQDATKTLGDALLPIMIKVTKAAADMLRWFNDLPDGMKDMILVVAAVVAALGPLLIVIGQLTIAISAIIPLLAPLAAGLGLTTAAALPMVAAFAAAVAVVWGIQEAIKSLEPVVTELAQSEKDAADIRERMNELGSVSATMSEKQAKQHKANAIALRDEAKAELEAARAKIKAQIAQVDRSKIGGLNALLDGFKNNKMAQEVNRQYDGLKQLEAAVASLDAEIATTDATIAGFSDKTSRSTRLSKEDAEALAARAEAAKEAREAIELDIANLNAYVAALAISKEAGEKEQIRQQLIAQGFAGSSEELSNLVEQYWNAKKSVDALNEAYDDEARASERAAKAAEKAAEMRAKALKKSFEIGQDSAKRLADAIAREQEKIKAKADQIGQDLARGIVNPIYELVNGKSSLKDAFKGVLMNINQIFMEETLWKPLEDTLRKQFSSLFEKGLSGDGGGTNFGGIGKIFGNLFGNKNAGSAAGQSGGGGFLNGIANFFGNLFGGGKAVGGRVTPNKAYMVGENRPEMFVPDSAGRVKPNPNSGGGGGGMAPINNNFYFPNASPERFMQSQTQVAATYQRALARGRRVS